MTGPGQGARPGIRAAIAAAAAIVVAMLAMELAYDAPLGDSLVFIGYELAFVVVPGWLLFRALSEDPGSPLRQIALGWALGAAVEVAAFMFTAAIDVRWLFTVFPLILGVPAGIVAWRRRPSGAAIPDASRWTTRDVWGLAIVCVLAMGLFALSFFPTAALPGQGAITYFRDYTWHLATAAEAKNHWPITDPNIAGEPLPYHWFAHLHMAGASQVTGIELPLVYFRLFMLPIVVEVVLLFALAGETLFRSLRIGLIAAALALFVGDLQLETSPHLVPHAPFLGVFIDLLITSPSFMYGLASFLALVAVVGTALREDRAPGPGEWIVLAVLVFGATNGKLQLLPVMLVSMGGLAIWAWFLRRELLARIVAIGALMVAGVMILYLLLYAGHSSTYELDPFLTFREMPVVVSVKTYALDVLPSFPLRGTLFGAIGVIVGFAGLLGGTLAGILWLRDRAALGRRSEYAWPAALLGAGLLFLLFAGAAGGGNQLYAVFFGVTGGSLLAAAGLVAAWARRPVPLAPGRAIALFAGFAVLLVLVMRIPFDFGLDFFTGPNALPRTYLAWYVGLLCLLIALGLLSWRLLRPAGWWTAALLTAAVVAIGLMGTIANYVAPRFVKASFSGANPTSVLEPGDYAALSWIRDNTQKDTVIAVDQDDGFRFDYAGFAERRVFLQGWVYSSQTLDEGYDQVVTGELNPYAGRRALNRAAFAGDPRAVVALARDYGVRYLVVDEPTGIPVDRARLAKLTTPVFRAPGMTVLRIDPAKVLVISGRDGTTLRP